VDIGDTPAMLADELCRMLHEDTGGCTPPLLVRWGKMRADIAKAFCCQQGIGESVQTNVCIRVAGEPLVKRNLYSTKGYVIAFTKTMNIIAVAGAHVGECGAHHSHPLIGDRNVACPGNLHVVG